MRDAAEVSLDQRIERLRQDPQDDRIVDAERAHLERQTLLQVARADPRRIELLDAGQR